METTTLLSLLPDEVIENILSFATCCSVCNVIGRQEKFSFNYTWCSLYKCDGCEKLFCDYCNHEDLVACCCDDQCGCYFCIPRVEQWVHNKIAWYMIKFGVWDRERNVLRATIKREMKEMMGCIRMKADMNFGEGSRVYDFVDHMCQEYNTKAKCERRRNEFLKKEAKLRQIESI